MIRPKSSGDTHTLASHNAAVPDPLPMPSPTKGILMTPGTAAGRRKTVSFGTHVQDNESKRPGKSGLPDSCPGKFPSPFCKPTEAEDDKNEIADRSKGRNKLTEKLEQVREDSVRRQFESANISIEPVKDSDPALDLADSGTEYWRIMFEQYREKSERECRKLVSKQRAAKSFAREKDAQLMEMADSFRQEKKKVDRLERQVTDLQAQLQECQERLRASQAQEQRVKEEASRRMRGSGHTRNRRHGDPTAAASRWPQDLEEHEEAASKPCASDERLLTDGPKTSTLAEIKDSPALWRGRTRLQSKTERGDACAPALAPSSLIPTKPDVPPPFPSPKASQPKTSTLPLKSLDTNTLPQDAMSIALSMGLQPPSPQRDIRSDSPMHSPTRSHAKPKGKSLVIVPESGTLPLDGENERPNVLTGTPVPIRSPILSPRRAAASTTRGNGSASIKAAPRPNHENEYSRTPNEGLVEGSEMDDAMKTARLRLAARGRAVS